jgi:hypothetical protein
MKKYLLIAASVALSLGLAFSIGGAASAHGKGKGGTDFGYGNGGGKGHHGAIVATGSTTCNIHGRLTINSNGVVTISGNLTPKHGKACTSTGGTKLKTGHFSTSLTSAPVTTTTTTSTTTTTTLAGAPTTTTMVCLPLPVGAIPNVSGGTISWSPKAKVASSVGVALTGGTISEVTNGSKQYLEIAYTGGSVASGSFAGSSGASLTVWSNQTVKALSSACSHHSHSIEFHGTLTL